ncbi:MAG TPA: glycosyltransferase family 4 protein [Clostridia bacterium]|nr:glycosyltransferase family 4 protein [Clostridia bacterium]
MNIAFFTDSFLPYTSGVVRSIETFSAELRALGHKVYIFAPDYPNCPKMENVFRFKSLPNLIYKNFNLAIPISPKLESDLHQLNIDIIHVHSPFLLGRLGAKAAKKCGIPLVYTYHTLYDQYVHYVPFAQNFSRWLVRKVSKDFCNSCDLVVTPTSIIENLLRQYGVTTKIVTIPTGIDLESYKQGDGTWLRSNYSIPKQDRILLFVGRLGAEKNLEFLINAFKNINKQLPDTTLVLVGGGPQEIHYKNLCKSLDIEKKVVFTGTLNKKQVINAYLGADLFVFASVTETQGLVLGEAKAAGLPIVAVEAFGTKEMVTSGIDGYLTPLSQEVFVDKVMAILNEPELYHKFSRNAKINVQKISSNNSAKRLISCYKTIIEDERKAEVV